MVKMEAEEFMTKFTIAQSEALVILFREAGIPTGEWVRLASLFAKTFQKALGNGDKDKS